VLQGPVHHTLPALLQEIDGLPARERATLQVTEEAREYLGRLQDLEAVEQQKKWFLGQVEKGRRSLQVIGTRLSRVRELTEVPSGDGEPLLPSAKSVETMITVVRQLIDVGHQQVVQQEL